MISYRKANDEKEKHGKADKGNKYKFAVDLFRSIYGNWWCMRACFHLGLLLPQQLHNKSDETKKFYVVV